MSNLEDKNLIGIEVKLEQELEAIPLEPFEEMMAELRPQLKKKRRRQPAKPHALMTRLVTVAASFILLLGIGLTAYFMWPKGETPPVYRYLDADIDAMPCEESDIINYPGLYVPDLDILIKDTISFSVGMHRETQKPVYYIVEGYQSSDGIARYIVLTIILEKKYEPYRENDYNADDTIMVLGREISVLEDVFDTPFYSYKLGFKIGDVRYYMDYQTMSETNDIESFMQLFLK